MKKRKLSKKARASAGKKKPHARKAKAKKTTKTVAKARKAPKPVTCRPNAQVEPLWRAAIAAARRGDVAAAKRHLLTCAKVQSNPLKQKRSNPQTPIEVALELIAKKGKREAARFAKQQAKHAKSHGYKKDAARWKDIRRAVLRVRIGSSKKSNPLSGVVSALANPRASSRVAALPVGRVMKWKDAPAWIKNDPKAKAAAMLAARDQGIPLDEVPGEVCNAEPGAPAHVASTGELVELVYKKREGVRRARTRTGMRIHWGHKAGDQGKGKKPTKPMLLAVDPETRHPILVSRRGSRPGFSSARGHTG